MQKYRSHQRGFTLLELLVVIAIILIVASLILPLLREKADSYAPKLEDNSVTF